MLQEVRDFMRISSLVPLCMHNPVSAIVTPTSLAWFCGSAMAWLLVAQVRFKTYPEKSKATFQKALNAEGGDPGELDKPIHTESL